MSMRQFCLSVLLLFCCFTSAQSATMAIVSEGQLIGFDNIVIGQETYNVRFVEGSFISIFGDSTGLDFNTSSDAAAAAAALLDAYDAFPIYDDDTSLTFGLTNTSGQIFTPWFFNPDGQTNTRSRNYFNIDADITTMFNFDYVTGNVGMIATYDTTGPNNFSGGRVWADWEIATAPVPVPTAFWLLGTGLMSLMGAAGKKRA